MFILIGVTGGSFYFFLQNTALTYTFAANVSIIIALSPILTVILACLLYTSLAHDDLLLDGLGLGSHLGIGVHQSQSDLLLLGQHLIGDLGRCV